MKLTIHSLLLILSGVWLLSTANAMAQQHYQFHARDYVSTDNARAPQSAFSYDDESNTMSIKASGVQNVAFKMSNAKDGTYYINPDEQYFVIAARNISATPGDTRLWWLNGFNNNGAVQPDSVYQLKDGTTLVLWHLGRNTAVNRNFDFTQSQIAISAHGNSFINALGMTAQDGTQPGNVSDVNYYSPALLSLHYPELMKRMGYTATTLTEHFEQKFSALLTCAETLATGSDASEKALQSLRSAIARINSQKTALLVNDFQGMARLCTEVETAIKDFKAMSFGQLTEVKAIAGGLLASRDSFHVRLRFVNDSIINIAKYYGDDHKPSEWVILPESWTNVDTHMMSTDTSATVTTSKMKAELDMLRGHITICRKNGSVLLQESTFNMTATKDGPQDSYNISQQWLLDKDEHIYGMGQLQDGHLDRRGQNVFLQQDNRSICIPLWQSSKNYTLYWDNYSPTHFTDDATGTEFSSTGKAIDYYVLIGDDSRALLRSLRNLTGNTRQPALWNFGLYQSKERYTSVNEVLNVLGRYRQEQVPIDCIVQDWQYWGDNNHWNAMQFLNPSYADYQRMVNDVHTQNARIMISVWPDFGPQTEQYVYLSSIGRLMPAQSWPTDVASRPYDCFDAGARDYYWSKLFNGIMKHGFDAYWLDSTEPDYFGTNTDIDYVTGSGLTWRALRNVFPLATVQGVYDHHRAEPTLDNKRVSIMTRSGFLGMQRTGAYVWSADITSSWDVLHNQIPAACNLSVSGLPFWNSDTGGFFVGSYNGGVNNEAWRRLYMRWTQFSTFTPMLRFHGTDTPREIWQFGSKGDAQGEYDNLLKYIKLRYRLIPYLYSTAHQIVTDGAPFMTALPVAFQHDDACNGITDEYMLGDNFLVAPVLQDGVTGRQVYLPAETNWVDFWTGETIDGGSRFFRTAPMNLIPLFVRTGSILPWGPDVQYADEKPWDSLEVRVYPGADGHFVLYEDEGENYNYEKGLCTEIPFTWNDATRTLTIGARKGQFASMLNKRTFRIVVVDKQHGTGDLHATKYQQEVDYNGQEVSITLSVNADSQAPTQLEDITNDYITNPSFETDGGTLNKVSPRGWTVESNTAWWGVNLSDNPSSTGDPLATDGKYIFGVWDGSTTLSPRIYQNLNNLPAGEYLLTVDMQASNRSNTVIRLGNQRLFAGDNTVRYADVLASAGVGDAYPMQTLSLPFILTETAQQFPVGVTTDGAPAETWFKIDNFRLYRIQNVTTNLQKINDGNAEENLLTTKEPRTYYNIMGQRIAHPTHGIFIVNGKKIIKP